ncbi:MAG: FG-GAP-like repeat-containing protein [Thermoanaerobaculia bacterium]
MGALRHRHDRVRWAARVLAIALLSVAAAGGARSQEDPEPAVEAPLPPPGEMARCKALIDAGQLDAARARLEPIVEAHPGWARARLLLGLTDYRENRFGPANEHFAAVLAIDPGNVPVLPLYGWSLYSVGELGRAEETFDVLVSRLPDYAPGYFGLGMVRAETERPEEAVESFRTAAQLAAAQGDAVMEARSRAHIGEIDLQRGETESALRELERAVELAPEDEEIHFLHARVTRLAAAREVPPDEVRPHELPATRAARAPGTATPEGDGSRLRFTAVPDAGGIDLVMTSGEMPSREILEVDGGGVALFDYDRDGDLDVFLANGATLADPEHGPGSRLYANRGDGRFDDATAAVGLDLRRWAMGVAVGDVDGDGWEDLYVTCFGPNALLRNVPDGRGGRRFVDVAAEAGVADERWSTSAALADLDADGDLDLYVANYLAFDPQSPPPRAGSSFKGAAVMAGPRGLEAQPDALFENLGDGRFREVTRDAGCAVDSGLDYGLGVRAVDVDADGLPDLFVGNDSTPDLLFRNLGGMRFEEIGAASGLSANGSGTTQASMGIGLVDADANGLPDLFVTVFSDDSNTLHANLGDGLFDDRTAPLGLGAVSRPDLGWGCGFFDFDLDGDEDLFVANGHVYPEMDDPSVGAEWAQRARLFERRGDRFRPAECTTDWCAERLHGRATAFGDLDGDLDPDVLMTTLNGPVRLLRNEITATDASSRALAVRLVGPAPDLHALGSVVELGTAGGTQRRWITGGGSFQSVDTTDALFGLPSEAGSDPTLALRIRRPGGCSRELRGIPPGRLLVVPATGRSGSC